MAVEAARATARAMVERGALLDRGLVQQVEHTAMVVEAQEVQLVVETKEKMRRADVA